MKQTKAGSARIAALVAAVGVLSVSCQQPDVGERAASAVASAGPKVVLDEVWVDLYGHPVATFTVTQDDVPLTLSEVEALGPRFTAATLTSHPVDHLRAWRSIVLTGAVIPRLPPAGPGTPDPEVLTSVRQPGAESPAALVDLGGGRFRYVFAAWLSSFDPDDTVRVGVWLEGVGRPSLDTCATLDFRPSGGPLERRDVVLDERCGACHAGMVAHEKIAGTRLCLTCHTWQSADPDTIDPAAAVTAAVTARTDPNPLELGRLVHRIHRGKNLPTLYASTSREPARGLPPSAAPPLPFFPDPARNPPVPGRKYAVVGPNSHEVVFGKIETRTDNGQSPGKVLAAGVVFPRELRDCAVCHEGAPQEYEALYAISRRTCAGCHPDVWFAPPNGDGTTSITDTAHFAHTGGPQPDDAQCAGCHVAPTAAQPKVWAPLVEIHVPPHRSPKYDRTVVEIVGVENARPGAAPVVKFKLWDRVGTFPQVGAFPAPAPVPGGSILPRTMHYLAGGWFGITVAGPTQPAYGHEYLLSELEPVPPFGLTPDGNGVFTYPFTRTLPASARGTWAVGIEARRRGATTHYDAATQQFRWPYTGEAISEPPLNPVVYVDTATGVFAAGVADAAVPRRRIVSQEKCNRCHDPIPVHGTTRMRVEYCVICHGPDRTDWGARPKVNGRVNLAGTFDGLEERSLDMKVMIHRIHTGGRKGVASLEGIEPHVLYGRYGTIVFFDEGGFSGDLANCTSCHEGKTYTVEAVPADAPPTRANETPTILHAANAVAHPAEEPGIPPVQAACLGCHASGATQDHARRNTVAGVEQCASCHVRGARSVDVAHGLAPPSGTGASATFASIEATILVPRCATSACHVTGVTPPFLEKGVGYDAMVGVQAGQASMKHVEPYEPERSYLVHKLRGTAGSVGGSVASIMPPDGALAPADLAAIEAWIASGAAE